MKEYFGFPSQFHSTLAFTSLQQVFFFCLRNITAGKRGDIEQLLEALRYKPQSRGFDSRFEFLIDIILTAALLGSTQPQSIFRG